MSKVMPNFAFKSMSFFMKTFKRPNYIDRRMNKLKIKKGNVVLDYACGPGIFTIPIARKVGDEGFVYAADIHPLAGNYINIKSEKFELSNIKFIQTNCKLPILDNTVDIALLFDCVHMFDNLNDILIEIHRVLSINGILIIDIHHVDYDTIKKMIETCGLFCISKEKNENHKGLYFYTLKNSK